MKGTDMAVKRYDIDVPDGEFVERANGRAVLYDDYAAVVAERDALAAVVSRLPKTADGVPVVPMMHLWSIIRNRDGAHLGLGVAMMFESDEFHDDEAAVARAFQDCYSTREAAAAALASKALPSHTARAVLGATDAPADHPMSKLIAEANAAIDAEGGDE